MEIVDEAGKIRNVSVNGFSKVFNLRFNGRLSRSQYFCITVGGYVLGWALYFILLKIFPAPDNSLDSNNVWPLVLYGVLGFFVFMRASILRLHDMGAASGFVFLFFLSAAIFYFVLCLYSPSQGTNKYGDPPINTSWEKWMVVLGLFAFVSCIFLMLISMPPSY